MTFDEWVEELNRVGAELDARLCFNPLVWNDFDVEQVKEEGGDRMSEEQVTISKKEYEKLLEAAEFLTCLEGAGVDNWRGYDYAWELKDKRAKEAETDE